MPHEFEFVRLFLKCAHNIGHRRLLIGEQIVCLYANAYKTYESDVSSALTNRKCKYETKNIITLTIDYKYVLNVNILFLYKNKNITIDLFCIYLLFLVKINFINFA